MRYIGAHEVQKARGCVALQVFDVNWDSVEDLYSAKSQLPSRLLFQLSDWRHARRNKWAESIKQYGTIDEPKILRARFAMPPGWFITGGPIVMPLLANRIRRLAKQYLPDYREDIAVFTSPHYLALQRALNPKFTVYHAVDDYARYWPRRARLTEYRERELVAQSSLIICAGAHLALQFKQRFPHRAGDIFHIPNPVPEGFISNDAAPSAYFSGKTRTPILGYVGALEDRFEYEAIRALCQVVPRAEIIILTSSDPKKLRASIPYGARVRIMPPVPRNQVPAILRSFDVCLLPQTISRFNFCASPRKLYEYLGSGRPIVALNTPEANTLEQVISVFSVDGFVESVSRLLKNGESVEAARTRLKLAGTLVPSCLADRYASILRSLNLCSK